MKTTLLLLPIFFILACRGDKIKFTAENTSKTSIIEYSAFKDSVRIQKARLKNKVHKDVANYLHDLISDDIYNYWNGTPWTFEGATRTPQQGSIACGYFVTNTLSDLGFKIDRVKLAQSVSATMIKQLCVEVHSFNGIANFAAYMDKQPVNSVYIVGLDFHTGYVVKDATGVYFLHSNYINKQGVIKELITESRALAKNKFFMIGSLSANKKRLQQWIKE